MSLLTNLISYWKLDEASGNALDAHGSNTLTETSGTIASTTGKLGNCRDFEAGDTEWFEIADNTDLSTGDIDFTFSCWVNFESIAGLNCPIIAKGSNFFSAAVAEYCLLLHSSNAIRFYVSDGGTLTSAEWGSGPMTGTWYHIVCWHDSVNNLVGIAVNNGTPVTTSYSGGVQNTALPFRLGHDGAGTRCFDGLIDEVGFWKRVLTSQDRTDLYNGGNGLAYSSFGGSIKPKTITLRQAVRRASNF